MVLGGLLTVAGCYSGVDFGLDPGLGPAGSGPGASGGSGDEPDDDGDGDDTAGDGEEACLDAGIGAQPLRRLTRSQYTNTIRDLIGVDSDVAQAFPPDERIGTFYSNGVAPVTDLVVEQYMGAAEELAAEADVDALLPCDPALDGEVECAHAFIDDFGRRAFRRPLRDTERAQMQDLYAQGDDFDDGVARVLEAFLQSPYLLYHVELGRPAADGEAMAALTGYEVASRLSYFLWDSMPDPELLDAAEVGELDSADGVRDQAERLLDDPRSAVTIASFHLQWLGVDRLEELDKDAELFPDFDEALAQAMKAETAAFADYVIRQGDGSLRTLLTASFSVFDDPALAELYGVAIPPGHVAGSSWVARTWA